MRTVVRKLLLPAVLVLFLLEVITFPVVLTLTYATKNTNPEHILTYADEALTWDANTVVRPDGSAELSLFETIYGNTVSDNGEKLLAPGTQGDSLVRLKNDSSETASYTAVVYTIKNNASLPVAAGLSGTGWTATTNHPVPEGVQRDQVTHAVTGQLPAGQIQDFQLDWHWLYEESMTQDELDTMLGDAAADGYAADVTIGIYILISGNDGTTYVPAPQMGHSNIIIGYVILLCVSAAVLLILIFLRRMERKPDEA